MCLYTWNALGKRAYLEIWGFITLSQRAEMNLRVFFLCICDSCNNSITHSQQVEKSKTMLLPQAQFLKNIFTAEEPISHENQDI